MKRATWIALALLMPAAPAVSHPGRTAADGCHRDRNERHCHGANARSKTTASEAGWARATMVVVDVVDGDTIKVKSKTPPETSLTVRLRGLDCPELDDGGADATAHLTTRVLGKTVVLQSGAAVFETDRFGRTLAYIEYFGVDIGRELIAQQLCSDFSHRFPHPRQDRYLRTQAKARGE